MNQRVIFFEASIMDCCFTMNDFDEAYVNHVTYKSVTLDRCGFWKSKIAATTFDDCRLTHSGFNESAFGNVVFTSTEIDACRFRVAKFEDVIFDGSLVGHCAFERADLSDSVLINTLFECNDLGRGTEYEVLFDRIADEVGSE